MSRSYALHILYSAVVFTSLFIATIRANLRPPKIVKQPPAGELLFDVHESFLLECEAEGEPIPEYRWKKDGRNFHWQTKNVEYGTLNFTYATSEDEGEYQCFSSNKLGTATSNLVRVVKNNTSSFENNQTDIIFKTVSEGEPYNITCIPTPTGRPKARLAWITEDSNKRQNSINDRRITVDPDGTLWFSYVTLNDANQNYLFAPRIMKQLVVRCPTKLEVKPLKSGLKNISPQIQYVTPKNKKVLSGKQIELFCIYSGNPLPETVWSINGSIIKNNKNVETRNYNKSLLIRNVKIEDKGTYKCDVSNSEGFKSHSIDLDVMEAPYFKYEPQFVEKNERGAAVIQCSAGGNPEPSIQWIHNGRPLNENLQSSRIAVTSNSITIAELIKNDTGNYGCNATNSVGYVYKDVYINVLERTKIIAKSEDSNVLVGSNVTFYCNVTTDPSLHPNFTWLFNNEPMNFENQSRITKTDNDLTISMANSMDSGNYTCVAKTELDNDTASVNLIVIKRTQIIAYPDNSNAVVGSNVTFYCNVTTDPSLHPNIEWLFNNGPMYFDNESRIIKTDNTLTLTMISQTDTGNYTCLATTESDNVTASVKLFVKKRTKIIAKSEDTNVLVGSNVTFYCNVTIDPSLHPNFTWLFNNEPMNFENQSRITKTDNDLTISMAYSMDSGDYTCVAKTELDNDTASVHLIVIERTQIIAYPDNSNAVVGSNVTFYCNVTTDPSLHPNIEWLFNNGPIYFDNQSRIINTDNTLTLTMISQTDTGNYTCLATTESDNVTASVKLFVKERTKIIAKSEDTNVLVGSNVTFYCNVTIDPSLHPNFTWLFNNEPMNFENQSRITKTDNDLTISMANSIDSGNYTCVAKTELDNDTASVNLLVIERTQIIAYPDNSNAVVGSNVTFYCYVTTDPSLHLNIEWLFNNGPMYFDNQSRIIKADNNLTLAMINKMDSGNYTCLATTESDNVTASVKLSVKERTKIKAISEDSKVVVGSNVTFYCNVTADPSLHFNITWLFNNEPINFVNQSQFTKTDNNLTISMANSMDSGDYTCVAKTELDNDTASVKLIIEGLVTETIHMKLIIFSIVFIIVVISIVCIVRNRNRKMYAVHEAEQSNTYHNFQNNEFTQPLTGQNKMIKNNQSTECETVLMATLVATLD